MSAYVMAHDLMSTVIFVGGLCLGSCLGLMLGGLLGRRSAEAEFLEGANQRSDPNESVFQRWSDTHPRGRNFGRPTPTQGHVWKPVQQRPH